MAKCAICLKEDCVDFQTDCGHFYHENCAIEWINLNSGCFSCGELIELHKIIEIMMKRYDECNGNLLLLQTDDLVRALEYSVYRGLSFPFETVVERLLASNWQINSKLAQTDENILCKFVTNGGELEMIRFLIEKGADVNSLDKFGNSMLWVAAKKGHINIIQLLIKNGAKLNNNDPNTTASDTFLIYETILECKLDSNPEEHFQNLVSNDLNRLIAVQADISNKTLDNLCQNSWEIISTFPRMALILIESGILSKDTFNVADDLNRTPLMYACMNHKGLDLADKLIRGGVEVNISDKFGNSPLHVACKQKI